MRHRSRRRGRVWTLTDLWTQRTRPPILAKPQNGFAEAPTRLIFVSLFRITQDQHLSESVVSYPQILRRRPEKVAMRAVELGRNLVPADLLLLGNIQTQAEKHAQAYSTLQRAAAAV